MLHKIVGPKILLGEDLEKLFSILTRPRRLRIHFGMKPVVFESRLPWRYFEIFTATPKL